jgi:hypothetical protein
MRGMRLQIERVALGGLLTLSAGAAFAQDTAAPDALAPADVADLPANPAPGAGPTSGGADSATLGFLFNPIDQVSFWLSIAFLAFGMAVLCLQLFMLSRVRSLHADDVAKNSALTVVVIASVVLLIAGYNSAQLGPVFGLFGTMVGYVLGRSSSRRENAPHENQQP